MSSRMITIPEYYRKYINPNVDLSLETKQCCPFHHEELPSFSYSPERGTWRCFGACKTGGDVIELHRMNFKLKSRAEAKASLMDILGIKREIVFTQERPTPNEEAINRHKIYHDAVSLATSIEDWLELDYIMSIYPTDLGKLDAFVKARS